MQLYTPVLVLALIAGAFAVAGVATLIVIALYFAFYAFVYLPRGVMQ